MSGASGRHWDQEMGCWITEDIILELGADGRRHRKVVKTPCKPVTERGGFVMVPHWLWSDQYSDLTAADKHIWATMRREIRVAKGEEWHGKGFTMSQPLLAKKAGVSIKGLRAALVRLGRKGLVVVTNRQVTNENSVYVLFDPEHVEQAG